MSITTTSTLAAAARPHSIIWMNATTFLSALDLSGDLAADGDGRVTLCVSCYDKLQAAGIVAEPAAAATDSQCLTCRRLAWGRYSTEPPAPPAVPPGPVLLAPADLTALGISVRPGPGALTPLDVAEVLGRTAHVAHAELVQVVASTAGGDEHLLVRAARQRLLALRAAIGLMLTIDRQLNDPAPDLLLRLRGVVDQLRDGYGAVDNDGPYAAEAAELQRLLDPPVIVTI